MGRPTRVFRGLGGDPRLTEVEGVRAVVHDSLRAHALPEVS